MRKYFIEVIITEGSDEWWEEITKDGKSGADEVAEAVHDALFDVGFQENCEVKLRGYKDETTGC